jgi:hypothetical protein
MQHKKETTKPVRIKTGLLDRLEKHAIKEGSRRQKLTSIAEIVDELLTEKLNEINRQDKAIDKSNQ